jgi:hypothetical protein
VADWRYVGLGELQAEMQAHPERFTIWFRLCLNKVLEYKQVGAALEPALSYIS